MYFIPELKFYFAPPINGIGPPGLCGLCENNHQEEESDSILLREFNFYKSIFLIFLGVLAYLISFKSEISYCAS